MATLQVCNTGVVNTGQTCVPVFRVQQKFIAVNTYDSTGVANEIDLSVTLNKAYFDALINHSDASKRWYPLPLMKNITDVRAESFMKEWEDGSKSFITQGIRSVNGIIVAQDGPAQMVAKIRAMRGNAISMFAIDKEGNIIGKVGSSSTKLAPIDIESDTIDAIFVKTIDKDIQQIQTKWSIAINEDDANLVMIQNSELATDVQKIIGNYKGLVGVTSVVSSITTTGFTLKLVTDGGTPITPVLVKGLVTADFVSSVTSTASKIRNSTTSADVTVTVTETSTLGVYTVAFSAQTSGNILIVKPSKSGFDFSAVQAATVTIP